jgi:hypothetical protein
MGRGESHPRAAGAGPIDGGVGRRPVRATIPLQSLRTRDAGFEILFIRLKLLNRCSIAVKSFLLTHPTGILGPLREIMVRLLLGRGLHGIVAEHPGKPFLLA